MLSVVLKNVAETWAMIMTAGRRIFRGAGVVAIFFMTQTFSSYAADSIPRWDIQEICAASNLGEKCPRIESTFRRAVFNRWEARPVEDRQACASQIINSGQRSYQRLLNCLEDRAIMTLDGSQESSEVSIQR